MNDEQHNHSQDEQTQNMGPEQEQEAKPSENEIHELKDQLLRVMAELDNTRKRAEREKIEAHKYGIVQFARDLLPIADNLRRALETVKLDDPALETFKSVLEGVQLTENSLYQIFQKHGIQKIDPLHEKFDHNYHQAMFEVPTESHPEGMVVQLLQSGYVIHDRLLRPALVGVAKSSNA
jgi:molecular chaperone GrpE